MRDEGGDELGAVRGRGRDEGARPEHVAERTRRMSTLGCPCSTQVSRERSVRDPVGGLRGEAELGPLAADDALQDAETDRVALAHPDGRVAELAELAPVLVVPAVGDVFAVEVERSTPGAVERAGPVAVPGGAQEEARITRCLHFE